MTFDEALRPITGYEGCYSIGAAQREHAKRMGTATRTLTPEQVRDARGRAAGGETLTSVAASLGLCIATTHSLIHRRTYRDI